MENRDLQKFLEAAFKEQESFIREIVEQEVRRRVGDVMDRIKKLLTEDLKHF